MCVCLWRKTKDTVCVFADICHHLLSRMVWWRARPVRHKCTWLCLLFMTDSSDRPGNVTVTSLPSLYFIFHLSVSSTATMFLTSWPECLYSWWRVNLTRKDYRAVRNLELLAMKGWWSFWLHFKVYSPSAFAYLACKIGLATQQLSERHICIRKFQVQERISRSHHCNCLRL